MQVFRIRANPQLYQHRTDRRASEISSSPTSHVPLAFVDISQAYAAHRTPRAVSTSFVPHSVFKRGTWRNVSSDQPLQHTEAARPSSATLRCRLRAYHHVLRQQLRSRLQFQSEREYNNSGFARHPRGYVSPHAYYLSSLPRAASYSRILAQTPQPAGNPKSQADPASPPGWRVQARAHCPEHLHSKTRLTRPGTAALICAREILSKPAYRAKEALRPLSQIPKPQSHTRPPAAGRDACGKSDPRKRKRA